MNQYNKAGSTLATVQHLRHNLRTVFNSTDGFSSPQHTGEHRRQSGFFVFVSRYWCALFMAGRSGEPSGCRFQCAGLLTLPRASHPRLAAGRWLSLCTGAHTTMKCPAFSPAAEVTL